MARAIEDQQQRRALVEQRRDRRELVREAGYSKVSGLSVTAGVTAACGALALLAGATAAIVSATGVDAQALSDRDWRRWGAIAGGGVAAAFLVTFLLGGYVAGRAARRAGGLHGLLVGFGGAVLFTLAGVLAYLEDGLKVIGDRLDAFGAPTGDGEWAGIVVVTGVATLVAMLVGGFAGGLRGEHWHQRLMDRALDPRFGPEAELGRRQRELEEAEQRLERDREEAERRGVLVQTREMPAVAWTNDAADTDAGAETTDSGAPF